MPKLAVFPKCYMNDLVEHKLSLTKWIDMAAELHVDGLELYPLFFESLEPDVVDAAREQARRHGMQVPMLCCSPDFTHPRADQREQAEKDYRSWLDLGQRLGCRYVRILSGQAHPETSRAEGIEWAVASIERMLEEAARRDLMLVMENHYKDGIWLYPEFAQPRDIFLEITGRIDHPNFGVNYDPSNALLAGDDPVELLDAVLGRVVTMHASDRRLLEGYTLDDLREADGTRGYAKCMQHGVIGQGMIDYPTIFDRLASAGFDGWVSIEDGENGMQELADSVTFLRGAFDRHWPGG